ncbi:MAG: undecaprenyl-diphosphatase UppP [Anaerolineae bacterium]
MNPLQAVVLGILQGATEFLPISSSAHLVLVPWLLGWASPGLVFDTIVHWGTAAAVVLYFARDLWVIIRDWVLGTFRLRPATSSTRLGWLIILGTIPAVLIGALGEKPVEALFAAPAWTAGFLLVTAVILVVSERVGRQNRDAEGMAWWEALLIGLAQGLALAPGISRSGATIAVGLVLGLRRPAAARFSFLLSVPVILGAGLPQLLDFMRMPGASDSAGLLAVGFLAAAVSGFLAIHFLLSFVCRRRLYPFAVYCALLGGTALAIYFLR